MSKLKKSKVSISKYLPVLIILLSLTIILGSTFAYFTDKKDEVSELTFSKVELSSETTTGINGVIYDALPGMPLVNGALSFSKSIDSVPIYVRAKLSYSLPTGASEGMNEILKTLRNASDYNINTTLPNNAKWSAKDGNYFYLLDSDNDIFKVDTIDTYVLSNELSIPLDLKNLDNNAQYMESINFHVAFQAIQADNITANINEVKDIFNQIFPENPDEIGEIKYSIQFMVDDNLFTNQEILKGDSLTGIVEPEVDGKKFLGWTIDGEEIVDINNLQVTSNMVLIAKFVDVYTVNYMYGGSVYRSDKIIKGEMIEQFIAPTETEKVFAGWYTDEACTNQFDIYSNVNQDLVLYSKFVNATSPSDFIFDGDTVIKYTGSGTEVAIPSSYSILGNENKTGRVTSISRIDSLLSSGVTYPVTLTDSSSQTIILNSYDDFYNKYGEIYEMTYPVTYSYTQTTYSYGNDYTVTKLGDKCFDGKDSVTSLIIPSSVTEVGENTFGYYGSLASLYIPYGVETIGRCSFMYKGSLTNVVLPSSLTHISDWTFYGCSALTSIFIPDSVNYIDELAFQKCTSLSDVRMPSTLTALGRYAFYETAYYNDIVDASNVINGVTYINFDTSDNRYIFKVDTSISSITDAMMENVTLIAGEAFEGCTNLVEARIPEGQSTISEQTFYNCTKLERVEIPTSVTRILAQAFLDCPALKDFDLPENLQIIGGSAFKNCTSLVNVVIPGSVESLGNSSYYNCTGLNSVIFEDGAGYVDENSFAGCTNLKKVEISSSVELGFGIFQGCTSLSDVKFADGFSIIGDYAFGRCSGINTITITQGVTSIGDNAFGNCTSLTTVYIDSEIIASGLTSKTSQGYLINIATSIYINSEITNVGSGVTKSNNITYTNNDKTYYLYTAV